MLDLLAGRYPSEEFAELRPRIVWDRAAGVVRGRAGAQRLAVTSGGTIPDRGLFGVFLPDGTRVGELDEEMVYESRAGETFLLGASTWRIEDITHERVVVTPAPGQPGKMPFWHGDGPGPAARARSGPGRVRPRGRGPRRPAALERLQRDHGLDPLAAANLLALPRRAGRGVGGRGARRPHHRGRAVPRRDRRLAGVRAHARSARRSTRRGAWRCRPGWPSGGASRSSSCGATTASSCACPRRSTTCPSTSWLIDPDEIDEIVVAPAARRRRMFAVALPRVRGPGAAAAAAPARSAHARCGSSGRRRPTCWRWRPSTPTSRSCSRPPASASTTCSTSPRCARC